MTVKQCTRLVREGEFAAEVGVRLIEGADAWSPYLSVDDACRLDDVRDALRAGDMQRASHIAARVYRLTPIQKPSRKSSLRGGQLTP